MLGIERSTERAEKRSLKSPIEFEIHRVYSEAPPDIFSTISPAFFPYNFPTNSLALFPYVVENNKLGIALNRQMIELMMIANAKSIEELKQISSELFIDSDSSNLELEQLKEKLFESYTKDLIDRNDLYNDPNANLNKKISNQKTPQCGGE